MEEFILELRQTAAESREGTVKIYFTRHGESQANLLHEISNRGLRHGLTLDGREQALALARRFEGHPIARIYSSPMLRAIETTALVANRLGVDYEVTDALREFDCGILEGRSDRAAWQGWRELFDAWTVHGRWEQRIEGGESFHEVRARFEPFIQGLVEHHAETDLEFVCVSHGGIYSVMLPVVLKNVDRSMIARYGFGYTSCVVAEPRPEGLFAVEWDGKRIG